ncbi:hypothetical protein ABK040_006879 [Willaertia magna]
MSDVFLFAGSQNVNYIGFKDDEFNSFHPIKLNFKYDQIYSGGRMFAFHRILENDYLFIGLLKHILTPDLIYENKNVKSLNYDITFTLLTNQNKIIKPESIGIIDTSKDCILFGEDIELFINQKQIIFISKSMNRIVYFENEEREIMNLKNYFIKMLATGPLSNYFFIVTEIDDIFRYDSNINLYTEKEMYGSVKLSAVSNAGITIVTNQNKVLIYGDNTFNCLGLENKKSIERKFIYLPVPFEKESNIINIQSGYFHTIYLLQNGNIYGCGNNFYKCSRGSNTTNEYYKDSYFGRFVLTKPLLNLKGIGCASRGTFIESENEAVVIGEVVVDLLQNNQIEYVLDYTKIKSECEVNELLFDCKLLPGGWHYVLGFISNEKKEVKQMRSILKKFIESSCRNNENVKDLTDCFIFIRE